MKKFTSILAAALVCGSLSANAQNGFTIKPAIDSETFEPTFKFSKENKYYAVVLDDETRAANIDDDQYVYVGPDADNGRNLWIWDGKSKFLENLSDNNSFNVPGNYMAYQCGDAGWSGLGYNVAKANPIDLSGITSEYTLHMALKSTDDDTFELYFTDMNDHQANLVFGKTAYDDKDAIGDFKRDGEWYNIDIPMSYLEDNFGFSFKGASQYCDKNLLCVLAGGRESATICYDAVFFYGPKNSTGVNGINASESNAAKSFYTISGEKVSEAYANANKGIYIEKQGNVTKKIIK